MLTRLKILEYRKFDDFVIHFAPDVNLIIGDNDRGKSTILQAIEMVTTGRVNGRPLEQELNHHWFPRSTTKKYCEAIKTDAATPLPKLIIEAYLSPQDELTQHKGKNNSQDEDCPGFRLDIEFDDRFHAEYEEYIAAQAGEVESIPTEFYRIRRRNFAGDNIEGKRLPISCAVIDASMLRLQSGADYYLRRAISEHLSADARARLALAFRQFREQLTQDEAFTAANDALNASDNTLNSDSIRLSPEVSQRTAWESTITPHLDDIPFSFAGKGEQSAFKLLLALEKNEERQRDILLIEEPENHLSFTSLNILIARMRDRSPGRQLILTTHSSFVLNKLGLDKARLLGLKTEQSLFDLPAGTRDYFKKLPGHDTLRVVLARSIILVEGPSDELVLHKAFLQRYSKLPLECGVDVISVQALAFKRFLELAQRLGTRVAVVTDLDDDTSTEKAERRYRDFENDRIRGFIGKIENGRSLEDQLVSSIGKEVMLEVVDRSFGTTEELVSYMKESKTDTALALLEFSKNVALPDYIERAVTFATQ